MVVILLSIIVAASLGLTIKYLMLGNYALALTYFGAGLLYLGLVFNELN